MADRRPTHPNLNLDFGRKSEWKAAAPDIATTSPHLEIIRSQSSGKLKFSPEQMFDFSASDLQDLGEIGVGNYGTVSKMVHRDSGIVMAVKRIRSTVNEKEQKQLLMELEAIMKSQSCPNIVQFYGAIFREGDCWICMELMDISLEKLYKFVFEKRQQRLPEQIIGLVTVSTLTALSYLKEHLKIIHRDVKPSNILLDRRGYIKLCDFGIAGQLVDSIARTRDAGCRPYMAPERLSQYTIGYDVRSDVWSLGITLVEIATGSFPYPSWNSVFEQLQQVVHGDAPVMTQSDIYSIDLINFVNSCLIKDEKERPKYNKLMDMKFYRDYDLARNNDDTAIERARASVGEYVAGVLEESTMLEHQRQNWVMF